jgi:hypothetical protein
MKSMMMTAVVLLVALSTLAGEPLPTRARVAGELRDGVIWGPVKDGRMYVTWKGGGVWLPLAAIPTVVLKARSLTVPASPPAQPSPTAVTDEMLTEEHGPQISGRVLQVLDEGLLVDSYKLKRTILWTKHPHQATAIDGQSVSGRGQLAGRYIYTDTLGARRTIEKWEYTRSAGGD